MKILFTICGRAGSKGFRNKNLKEMNGVPLVFYTLAAIKGFMDNHRDDTVTVSLNTDSELLVETVKTQQILPVVFVERKKELAGDLVPKVEVIRDTYLSCADTVPDVVVDLDITSPMRRVKDIESVIEEYKKKEYDLVFSVVNSRRSPYFNMVEQNEDGYYRKICRSSYTARQQAPKTYEMNASIYAYRPKFLEEQIEKTILDYYCGISVMPDYLVLDIDSEEDFRMMEYLHRLFCQQDEDLNKLYRLARQF